MLIKADIHYQSVKKVHIEVTYGWLLFWHHLAITPTHLFFPVTKERKPIQTRRHKVKFEDQSDPMSGQTLTYLFWAMANMFFPILTEETRDFSVLAVNILYPGRASSDRSYANPLTVYTHWSGHRSAVSGWCTLFTSGCSLPVLFFTSPLVRGQIRSKKSASSPIAI